MTTCLVKRVALLGFVHVRDAVFWVFMYTYVQYAGIHSLEVAQMCLVLYNRRVGPHPWYLSWDFHPDKKAEFFLPAINISRLITPVHIQFRHPLCKGKDSSCLLAGRCPKSTSSPHSSDIEALQAKHTRAEPTSLNFPGFPREI